MAPSNLRLVVVSTRRPVSNNKQIVLHISSGQSWRQTFVYDTESLPVTLGRASTNSIRLPDRSVSRQHCVFESVDGAVQVRDVGSRGGTWINGRMIENAVVQNGDVVRVGAAVVRIDLVAAQGHPKAQPQRQDINRTTDAMRQINITTSCEMCGISVSTEDLLVGARLLQDGRGLCSACMGHLDGLASFGCLRFLRPLGTGACGTVYKALHLDWQKIVAVKAVGFSEAPGADVMARLLREVKIGRKLRHPNIVALHEASTDGNNFYVIMDYIDGGNLDQRVKQGGRLSDPEAATLSQELGAGLEYAHEAGVVHRDVKPANILLGTDGCAHITDFGLARGLAASGLTALTTTGEGMGTPRFMAPEQFEDAKHAGDQADVYALAATLYFALSGRAPYEEIKTLKRLYSAILENTAEPVTRWRPDLSAEVGELLRVAMSSDPEDRPDSTEGLGKDMARLLSGAGAGG